MKSSRPRSAALVASLLTIAALTVGSASAQTPADIGAWGAPFEEGGTATPQCRTLQGGELVCKPTAVSIAPLVSGKILYWSGIEGTENIQVTAAPEGTTDLRDSQARVLDLSGATPTWKNPLPERGVSGNEAPYYEELPPDQALLGELGAPGRPGDGLTGSTLGQLYEGPPVAPPDDPYENDADMFCADLVQLRDGRLLIAGGTDAYNQPNVPYDVPMIGGFGVPELEGLRNTRIYDPATDTFKAVAPMKYGRWYPTLVTLPNGDVWVASGVTRLVRQTQASQVRRTETFRINSLTWEDNYASMASENSLPLYPRVHLMPNGKIFYTGSGQMNGFTPTGWALDEPLWSLQQFYNPQTKEWEVVGPSQYGVRGGAFSVMLPLKPPYDAATILLGGGTLGPTPSTFLATPIVERITVTKGGDVTSETSESLNNPRWFGTPVLLPDGKVALFSGANADEVLLPGLESAVREAEMYDPATDTWTPIGDGARDRTYHNSAILLPDARVLVGGHSPIPFMAHQHMDTPAPLANNHKDPSFEIYSPPYLFRGARPEIDYSPSGIMWGKSFPISLGGGYDVDSVTLIRLAAQTHTMQADMRSVNLAFTKSGNTLTVQAPPNGVVAPPGPYYLFVNRKSSAGPIPSLAAVTMVGQENAVPAFQPARRTSVKGARLRGPGGRLVSTETIDRVANPPEAVRNAVGRGRSALASSPASRDSARAAKRGLAVAIVATCAALMVGTAFVRRLLSPRRE